MEHLKKFGLQKTEGDDNREMDSSKGRIKNNAHLTKNPEKLNWGIRHRV